MLKFPWDTFLLHTNVLKPNTLDNVLDALRSYPNVGKLIHKRPQSDKAPNVLFLQMTILQLLTSSIIKIVLSNENIKALSVLTVDKKNSSPNYLHSSYWEGIPLANK